MCVVSSTVGNTVQESWLWGGSMTEITVDRQNIIAFKLIAAGTPYWID